MYDLCVYLSSIANFVLCYSPVEARVKAPFFVVLVGSMRVKVIACSEARVRIGELSLLKFLSVSLTAVVAKSFSTRVEIPY